MDSSRWRLRVRLERRLSHAARLVTNEPFRILLADVRRRDAAQAMTGIGSERDIEVGVNVVNGMSWAA